MNKKDNPYQICTHCVLDTQDPISGLMNMVFAISVMTIKIM